MKSLDCNNIDWSAHFIYDTTSPTFLRWKTDRYAGSRQQIKRRSAGDIAGSFGVGKKDGYKTTSVSLGNTRYRISRIIYCMHHGSIDSSMAIDHINGCSTDNRIENLRLVQTKTNNRNAKLRKDNVGGVSGVRVVNSKGSTYASARWRDATGTLREKWFSVRKLGLDEAVKLATKVRGEMIEKLNSCGAGYSSRHGT